MRTNLIRVISIILLAVMLVTALSSIAYVMASEGGSDFGVDDATPGKMKKNAKDKSGVAQAIFTILQAVLTITQVIGVGVAVIMLIVLAIKYISAAPNDKAEIKKHMVVYVVGAVILFGAAGILEVIKKFAKIFDDSVGVTE